MDSERILCYLLSVEMQRESISSWGPIVFPYTWFKFGNVYDAFKASLYERHFWNLKHVSSPEGKCRMQSVSSTGPIVFISASFGLGNVHVTFTTFHKERPKQKLKNVLSTIGRCLPYPIKVKITFLKQTSNLYCTPFWNLNNESPEWRRMTHVIFSRG